MEFKTGPGFFARNRLVTGAQGKYFPYQVISLPGRPGAGYASDVPGAVVVTPPGYIDGRPIIFDIDFDIWKTLIVFEQHVEMRSVFFDQLAFEYQGGDLGLSDYKVDYIGPGRELLRLFGEVGGLLEVALHPVAQVGGLANIDNLTLGVSKNVDAGFVRQEL
jgi:hypothetical protein